MVIPGCQPTRILSVQSAGIDVLTGGTGSDRFIFFSGDGTIAARDRISDFRRAQFDVIDLAGIDANTISAGDQAYDFIGTSAFTATAGQLRYSVTGSTTTIYGDMDGDGVADFGLTLSGVANVGLADFVL